MKICICTTPIRPKPTNFPPFGSMAIIQALRDIGEETSFFHIDYHRYNNDQIIEYFSIHKFDLVGISAVVSTAYSYIKYFFKLICEHLLWSLNIFKKLSLPQSTLRKTVNINDTNNTLELRHGR